MPTSMLCAHVQKDKRRSFEPKSRKCVFLGYPVDYKGWKCWDPVTNEVFICRDVRFVETEMPGAELGLSGPCYEPLRGVQPGSVGELAGNGPALSVSPSVPSVDPASTHSDDADSDSGSEADVDDADNPDFVPPVLPDSSPSPSQSPGRDSHPDFPPSPSASSPSPSPSSSSDSDSDSDSNAANARPHVRSHSHSRPKSEPDDAVAVGQGLKGPAQGH